MNLVHKKKIIIDYYYYWLYYYYWFWLLLISNRCFIVRVALPGWYKIGPTAQWKQVSEWEGHKSTRPSPFFSFQHRRRRRKRKRKKKKKRKKRKRKSNEKGVKHYRRFTPFNLSWGNSWRETGRERRSRVASSGPGVASPPSIPPSLHPCSTDERAREVRQNHLRPVTTTTESPKRNKRAQNTKKIKS